MADPWIYFAWYYVTGSLITAALLSIDGYGKRDLAGKTPDIAMFITFWPLVVITIMWTVVSDSPTAWSIWHDE